LLVGGGLGLVMLVGVAALAFGEGGRGSGCVTGLVDHMPTDAGVVQGSDLARAREAGYDDGGDVANMADSVLATGVMPDPVTHQSLQLFVEPSEYAGYEPADVDCWLGPIEPSFVARGSFDADRIRRSDRGGDGSVVLDDGLLAYESDGEPGHVLGTRDQPATLRDIVDAFDQHGAVSFSATSADDPSGPWSGVALARGDDWEMLVMWTFPDTDAAGAAESDVRGVLGDDSVLGELIEGDPADLLERDGTTLWLRAPLAAEPRRWLDPLRHLDPAVLVLSDLGD
jgi:hypothetical protein